MAVFRESSIPKLHNEIAQENCAFVLFHKTKQRGRNSVNITAIHTCNYFLSLNGNKLLYQLSPRKLKYSIKEFFINK